MTAGQSCTTRGICFDLFVYTMVMETQNTDPLDSANTVILRPCLQTLPDCFLSLKQDHRLILRDHRGILRPQKDHRTSLQTKETLRSTPSQWAHFPEETTWMPRMTFNRPGRQLRQQLVVSRLTRLSRCAASHPRDLLQVTGLPSPLHPRAGQVCRRQCHMAHCLCPTLTRQVTTPQCRKDSKEMVN